MMSAQINTANSTFSWLHITDLHVGMTNQDWLWPTLKSAIFRDLTKVHQLSGNWDLVIFSGDLVQRGDPAEYDKLNNILRELWAHFEQLGFSPELIVLPGNHDLKRPALTGSIRSLRHWWDDPELREEFFRSPTNEFQEAVKSSLENYSNWFDSAPSQGIKLKTGTSGLLPGDCSYSFAVNGMRVGVVTLNSTWLQLTDDNYNGRLHVDTLQLVSVTNNDADQWCEANDLNLLVTHHPTTWLHDSSLEQWKSEINPPGRFDAHIFGHVHTASAMQGAHGGKIPRVELQGISTFGLTKIHEKLDRAHGYSVVRFRADENRELQVWPRRSHDAIGGGYNIVADPGFDLDAKQSFHIPLSNKTRPTTQPSEPQSLQAIPNAGTIQASLLEFEYTPSSVRAHANVRTVEHKLAMDALHESRACWIVAEWGLGEEPFIANIKQELPAGAAYRLDLSEFQDGAQFSEALRQAYGFNFERFVQLLSESGATLVLLDNILQIDQAPRDEVARHIESLAALTIEFCPSVYVLMRSYRAPPNVSLSVVQLSALDAADVRNYIMDHPDRGDFRATSTAVDQIHRHTDGIPSRIDQALKELQVVSLSELVNADVDFVEPGLVVTKAPDALRSVINQLSESTDTASRRSFSLLKVLSLFPQGEGLKRIERFYSTSKFHPSLAADLRERGFVEVVSYQTQGLGAHYMDAEPEKKLKIGLSVRECVWDLLKADEPYELNRRAAELCFGPSWHSGQFKPPRSYRFDSPNCPPADILNASTILVRLLKEAISIGTKLNIERVLGLSFNYVRALIRGDHYANAADVAGDLLSLVQSDDYEDHIAQLSAEYGNALRMCGEHEKAKNVLQSILDHDFPNWKRQSILIDLAWCYESLNEISDTLALANDIIAIDPNTSHALQAESLLIELARNDPQRMEKLEALEIRARKQDANIVAGNIALTRARHNRNDPEAVRRILEPLTRSKRASDHYNRARATVDLAEATFKSGRTLTDAERIQLVQAYHYVFNEHMPALFDRLHSALWTDFHDRGDVSNLLVLFRHSSLRWRLRGADSKEQDYLERLKTAVGDVVQKALTQIEREVTYFLVRRTHFQQD